MRPNQAEILKQLQVRNSFAFVKNSICKNLVCTLQDTLKQCYYDTETVEKTEVFVRWYKTCTLKNIINHTRGNRENYLGRYPAPKTRHTQKSFTVWTQWADIQHQNQDTYRELYSMNLWSMGRHPAPAFSQCKLFWNWNKDTLTNFTPASFRRRLQRFPIAVLQVDHMYFSKFSSVISGPYTFSRKAVCITFTLSALRLFDLSFPVIVEYSKSLTEKNSHEPVLQQVFQYCHDYKGRDKLEILHLNFCRVSWKLLWTQRSA